MSEKHTNAILQVLKEGPCPTKDLAVRVARLCKPEDRVVKSSIIASKLRRNGLIRLQNGLYQLTDLGRIEVEPANKVVGNRRSMGGSYQCPELGQTCFRPNAYDFLSVPSLFGQERRTYKFKSGV